MRGQNRNRQQSFKLNTTQIVKLLILTILNQTECYSTELINQIETVLNNRWRPSNGLVYPILKDLKENDYVVCEEGETTYKKNYSITERGREYLEEQKAQYESLIDENIYISENILKEIYNISVE